MAQLANIIELFSSARLTSFDEKEDQDKYVLSATIPTPVAPDAHRLWLSLAEIPEQDRVEIVFGGDRNDILYKRGSNEDCSDFARDVGKALSLDDDLGDPDDNETRVVLTITKDRGGDALSLYSLDSFTNFLSELSVGDKLTVFRNILGRGTVRLRCHAHNDAFETLTMVAAASNSSIMPQTVPRQELASKRDEVCHFQSGGFYSIVPEDFCLRIRSRSDTFNAILDTLCLVISTAYLADISDIEGNTIFLKINGYKVLSEKLNLDAGLKVGAGELFTLYQWAYSGGNVSDKVGIIRNLISLYAKTSILDLEPGIFSAARSNYEIYLKENIGRYLEIKNTIAEKVLEMSQNCTKATEAFGSYFKQSIFAVSSFFITIVVLAAIDKEKYGKVFSSDVKHVSLVLILISFVHMIFSVIEFQSRCKRFSKEYKYLKESYSDVLDSKDLERIFENDRRYNEDYEYLQAELVRYFSCWMGILFILLVGTLTISAA